MHAFARKMLEKKNGAVAIKNAGLAETGNCHRGISRFSGRVELALAAPGNLAAGDQRPSPAPVAGSAGGDYWRAVSGEQGALVYCIANRFHQFCRPCRGFTR